MSSTRRSFAYDECFISLQSLVLPLHRFEADESNHSQGSSFFAFDHRDLARVELERRWRSVAPPSFVFVKACDEREKERERARYRSRKETQRNEEKRESNETCFPRSSQSIVLNGVYQGATSIARMEEGRKREKCIFREHVATKERPLCTLSHLLPQRGESD